MFSYISFQSLKLAFYKFDFGGGIAMREGTL